MYGPLRATAYHATSSVHGKRLDGPVQETGYEMSSVRDKTLCGQTQAIGHVTRIQSDKAVKTFVDQGT